MDRLGAAVSLAATIKCGVPEEETESYEVEGLSIMVA